MTKGDITYPHTESDFFREVLNQTEEAIIIIDQEGVIVYVNDAFLNLADYTSKDAHQFLIENVITFFPEKDSLSEYIKELYYNGPEKRNGIFQPFDDKKIFVESKFKSICVEDQLYLMVCFGETREYHKELTSLKGEDGHYQQLIESVQDIIYRVNADGRYSYANPTAEIITGFSMNELLNKHFLEMVREDYVEKTKAFYAGQIENETPVTYFELPIITKSGEEVWIGQNVQLFKRGDQVEFTAVARNITSQVNAQKEKEEASDKLKTLIDNLRIGILFEDPDRNILTVNQHLSDLFGLTQSPEELEGQNSWDVLKGQRYIFEDPQQIIETTEKRLHKRAPYFGEKIHLANGKVYERDYIPLISGNQYVGHIWKFHDITETRRIQQKIKDSEKRYRTLVNHSTQVIFRTDLEGRWFFLNPAWSDITGYDKQHSLGKHFSNFLHPKDRAYAERMLSDIANGKRTLCRDTFRFISKVNDTLHMELFAQAIFNNEGQIEGIFGTLNNISDRVKYEKALREAKDEAEEASRAKAQFLSHMSHEIRTPLNAIIGLTNLLLDQNPKPEQLTNLKTLKFSGDNLLALINDVLDFNKIEAGRIEFEEIDFDLVQVTNSIVRSLSFKADEKAIDLNVIYDEELPKHFKGDPTRLTQIITNLVNNAIKFTHEGSVEVWISHRERLQDGYLVDFSVKDTGIGIPQDKLQSIFESFQQADTDTTRNYGGTGLGLSITKKLLELQNSQIKVDSKVNEGSQFYFTLKLNDASEALNVNDDEADIKGETDFTGNKVLVVEDNSINVLVIRQFLEKWNLDIDVAEGGKQAIAKLDDHSYDLVLLDLQMPEINGFQVMEEIQSRQNLDKLPVVALTAETFNGIRTKVMEAGMNDYLSKPFKEEQLLQILNRFLVQNDTDESDNNENGETQNPDSTALNSNGTANIEEQEATKEDTTELLFDYDHFMEQTKGDKSFAKSMIDIFLKNTPTDIANLQEAASNKEWKQVGSIAHKLKPSLKMMGAEQLSDMAKQVEIQSKNGDEDLLVRMVNEFAAYINRACEELKTRSL